MGPVVEFQIQVYDGECLPVAELEIGARFTYEEGASTWSRAVTDGDGRAAFREAHAEVPSGVDVFVGDRFCDHFEVENGSTLILEV